MRILLYECRTILEQCSARHLGFQLTSLHERENIKLLLNSTKQLHTTNVLATLLKSSALSLSKTGAIWPAYNVLKSRREVQIIALLD